MAVILVRGVGVPSEDTEGPSELASVPAGPQLSLHVGAHRVRPEPSSHPFPSSESQGAKVSVQWDGSDCQRGEGLGAASRDGDKDLRGSDDVRAMGIAISGPRFFSVTDGAPCSADS